MTRWFTSPTPGPLAIPVTSFTRRETSSYKAILDHASGSNGRAWEIMHCLDADGIILVATATGKIDKVELTDAMRDACKAGPTRFWHNHPSGKSLSAPDWWLAACENAEVLAMNNYGSIFAGRLPDWLDNYKDLLKAFPDISGDVEVRMSANLSVELRSLPGYVIGHLVNLSLAELGIVHYAWHLAHEDQLVWDLMVGKGVVASGMAHAKTEFGTF